MNKTALKQRLVKILRAGKITPHDINYIGDCLGIVPNVEPIFFIVNGEPDTVTGGRKMTEPDKIAELYFNSLTNAEKWQLTGDDVRQQRTPAQTTTTHELTRPEKILFLSILRDGIDAHTDQLKKIVPEQFFVTGVFCNDGKIHLDKFIYPNFFDDEPPQGFEIGQDENTPLLFWGGTIGDYMNGTKQIPEARNTANR